MAVSIVRVSGEELVSLDGEELQKILANGDSIKSLKRYLRTFCSMSIYRIRLLYEGQEMKDEDLLSQVKVPSELSVILCDEVLPSAIEAKAFLKAVAKGKTRKLEDFLQKGINPNLVFQIATRHGSDSEESDSYTSTQYYDIDLDLPLPPLSMASAYGHTDCIRILLDAECKTPFTSLPHC